MPRTSRKQIEETDFSRHLKRYLQEHEITVAELAAEVGMDRVTIFRYVKGERKPEDAMIVEKMLDALRMRNAERELILEEYDRAKMGDEVVESHKYMKKLMEELKKVSEQSKMKVHAWKQFVSLPMDGKVLSLNSQKEIEMCAAILLENVAKNADDQTKVHILMQPSYPLMQELMLSTFENTKVVVEQIVCLEQNTQKSYRNLESFRLLVPSCFANMNYKVRYYYSSLTEHINEMTWMPNVILTDDGILQFDFAMESGVFVQNDAYVESIQSQYEYFQKHSKPFFSKTEGLECTQQLYEAMLEDFKSPIGEDDRIVDTLFVQPCLGMCVSSDMYKKYLYPSPVKELFTMGMAATRGDWNGLEHLHSGQNLPLKTVNFFKLKGLKDFMESGRIREFPSAFYEPIGMEDRKATLQRMFVLLEEGNMKYHIVDDTMELPENICFYIGGGERMFLNMVKDDSFIQIQITERGICQVFRQYMKYSKEKNMIYNAEQSEEILKKFAEENGIVNT